MFWRFGGYKAPEPTTESPVSGDTEDSHAVISTQLKDEARALDVREEALVKRELAMVEKEKALKTREMAVTKKEDELSTKADATATTVEQATKALSLLNSSTSTKPKKPAMSSFAQFTPDDAPVAMSSFAQFTPDDAPVAMSSFAQFTPDFAAPVKGNLPGRDWKDWIVADGMNTAEFRAGLITGSSFIKK